MRWPPYHHVFFDCDSTLTSVEGIDVLAESAGKGWRVEVLTRAAMDGELDLEEVYSKRLQAVRPTRKQVRAIRQKYKQNVVEDAAAVIAALQALGHQVYIISGGLAEPVREFGLFLGVDPDHIRAVDLRYNALSGRWWENRQEVGEAETSYLQFDEGALTLSDGKAEIVRELIGNQPGRSLLIGDGHSDLLAGRAVDLFVGFGGVVSRESVRAAAPAFIHSTGLAPLLALAVGPALLPELLTTEHAQIAQKAIYHLSEGVITFQDERLSQKFKQAYQAIYSRPH
jgi:phosphoserine phosphatase